MDLLENLKQSLSDRYDIQRQIGAGGMATVYLARDLRHDRPVALKLLSPELGAVLGPDRFLSEIRVTANLQHPNLLPLFDSGEAGGQLYYVMPYVDGETLRGKLDRERQLPVDEAVRITVAIAAALDYAHRHGVIHRDLKPENILIHDGQPLVADFGIALAVSNAGGQRVTQSGLSLGTPQYMSPEQATGDRVIDARTDVYSLGALLYEMLSGDPPHTGSTAQAIIARLLTEKPRSIRATRSAVPEHVELAVQKALEKLPADRFATARQFSEALTNPTAVVTALTAASAAPGVARTSVIQRWSLPVAVGALVVAAAAIGAALWQYRKPLPAQAPTRFAMSLGNDIRLNRPDALPLAISDDGRMIAYSGVHAGQTQIYIRSLGDIEPRPVAGTQGGGSPFFSPNGKYLGFVTGSKMWRVPVSGGMPTPIMDIQRAEPAQWIDDDRLLTSTGIISGRRSGLTMVTLGGGTPRTVFRSDSSAGENLTGPIALDDDIAIFNANGPGGYEDDYLSIGSIKSGKFTKSNILANRVIGYAAGAILYVQTDGELMAVAADVRGHKITGEPFPLVDGILDGWQVALSRSGTLVYLEGGATASVVLVDEKGQERPVLQDLKSYADPRFSPDGKHLLLTVGGVERRIWDLDLQSGIFARVVTSDLTWADRPEWTADGKRILFRALSSGSIGFYWMPADGSSAAEPVPLPKNTPTRNMADMVASPDGRWFLYRITSRRRGDLMYSAADGSGESMPFAATSEDERAPRFSPDGNWVAFTSSAEGALPQIYVKGFPNGAVRIQVSSSSGTDPMWSRDGKTLYFRDGTSMVAAKVNTSGQFTVSSRTPLFRDTFWASDRHSAYDVSPSGQFAMLKTSSDDGRAVVVLNWLDEVKSRLARDAQK